MHCVYEIGRETSEREGPKKYRSSCRTSEMQTMLQKKGGEREKSELISLSIS